MNIGTVIVGFIAVIVVLITLASTIKINKQWEKAVIFRLGKFNRLKDEGVFFKIPFIESAPRRDMRIQTLDIRSQKVITKDNITLVIDAVVFLKVEDAAASIINVMNYIRAVEQFAQPTLKNIVGEYELDSLLTKREEIAEKVKKMVDTESKKWGVDVQIVELQDIVLPEEMQRVIARQAEAEREKRGVIIKSEGELEAAQNLQKAAEELGKAPHAIELRRLSTLADVSQDQSNTIVFAVPLESLTGTMAATSGLQVPKPSKTE